MLNHNMEYNHNRTVPTNKAIVTQRPLRIKIILLKNIVGFFTGSKMFDYDLTTAKSLIF